MTDWELEWSRHENRIESLRLFLACILPVLWLDSCANRDPVYYLDSWSELVAISPSSPLTFRSEYGPQATVHLTEVTDFRMNEAVFTGKTQENYFVFDRTTGINRLFLSEAGRNSALQAEYGVTVDRLRLKPWYARFRADIFFPYNLIYYALVTAVAVRRWLWTEPVAQSPKAIS